MALAFGLGAILGTQSEPGKMVWITETVGFSPHESPLLNGLFVAATVLIFALAIALGRGVIIVLLRYNIFWEGAATLMLVLALAGLVLCVFGPQLGLEFETGQQVVFGFIAVVFGAFGAAMLRNALRQRRDRAHQGERRPADPK